MKRTVITIALVLVSVLLLTTASYAWFSMNRTVLAEGMKVKVQTTSSLVISSDRASLGTSSITNLNSTIASLIPCTHDTSLDGGVQRYASGLKQLNFDATEAINAGTGLKEGGALFTETDYINARKTGDADISDSPNGGIPNYIDFMVYIASKGEALTGQDIIVTIGSDKTSAEVTDTWKAVSIDFYYQSTNGAGIGDYKGTLNLAGLDYSNYLVSQASFRFDAGDIPFAADYDGTVETGSVKVTMRVYFDGALQSAAGQCFVNTNTANTGNIGVTATFTAVPNA